MNTFKVGDKVRRIAPLHLSGKDGGVGLNFFCLPKDEEAIIIDVGDDYVYTDKSGDWPIHIQTLEKVNV